MEAFHSYINGLIVISPWEAMLYTVVVTLLTLLRLNESCLINTFSFSFYWGFKNLIDVVSFPSPEANMVLSVYLVSGLAIFSLLHLYYLRRFLAFLKRNSESQDA